MATLRRESMILEKWYLDATLADGTVWYGYHARLRLGGCLQIPWVSGRLFGADGAERQKSRWTNWAEPQRRDGSWHWAGPDGFEGRWAPTAQGVESGLASDDQFRVRWNCIAPRAIVTRPKTAPGEAGCAGTGYLEHLRMETGAAAPPFRRLWWGRAYAGDSSLVWIRWGGGREFNLLLENGGKVDGRIEPEPGGDMRILTPRGEWRTAVTHRLCDRDVSRSFPRWLVWLVGRVVPRRELKLTGPARLRTASGEISGSAIWEEVHWL